jgi:glutaredoxin 3
MRLFIAIMVLIPFALAFRSMKFSTMSMSAATEKAKAAIDSNTVMVFSKTYCPYCVKAKAALTGLNLQFNVFELDNMNDGDDIQKALEQMTGQRTVPNVFIKGKHLGGCDKTLAAIADGSLKKMLA